MAFESVNRVLVTHIPMYVWCALQEHFCNGSSPTTATHNCYVCPPFDITPIQGLAVFVGEEGEETRHVLERRKEKGERRKNLQDISATASFSFLFSHFPFCLELLFFAVLMLTTNMEMSSSRSAFSELNSCWSIISLS